MVDGWWPLISGCRRLTPGHPEQPKPLPPSQRRGIFTAEGEARGAG